MKEASNPISPETQLLHRNRQLVVAEFFQGRVDEIRNFRVTTDSLPIPEPEQVQLDHIARLMPPFINGLGKLIALSTIDDKLRRADPTFRSIRRVLGLEPSFSTSLKPDRKSVIQDEAAETAALAINISSDHPFIRIDLIKHPVTNQFFIAEVEVDKLHGFGYATLCRHLSTHPPGFGLANLIARISRDTPTGMLLSGLERFYVPEAIYFARQVRDLGGQLQVIFETSVMFDRDISNVKQVLTLPTFKGKPSIPQVLTVLSHRQPALGEKSALGIISNPSLDPNLEQLLNLCFDPQALHGLRQVIPATHFLSDFHSSEVKQELLRQIATDPEQFFVKVKNQSGARGVAQAGDQAAQLDLIRRFAKDVVIQQTIPPYWVELPYMDVMTGYTGTDLHTIRYGLFVSDGAIMDLALTASPSPVAHGGKTSIQMGARLI
jgi:hypothetical protein